MLSILFNPYSNRVIIQQNSISLSKVHYTTNTSISEIIAHFNNWIIQFIKFIQIIV